MDGLKSWGVRASGLRGLRRWKVREAQPGILRGWRLEVGLVRQVMERGLRLTVVFVGGRGRGRGREEVRLMGP